MADQASNQKLTISTTGSPHVARTGPPDVCLLPDKKTPIPPFNEVPTTRASTHTSQKTLIAEHPIVQKGDKIGPPSDPAHAGTAGGVKSGTYRDVAEATDGSPNVKTEGGKPARHTDPTTQNKANTTGTVVDITQVPKADAAPREPAERCTVTDLVLECAHKGRKTTEKDPFLDVLKGDTVKAKSTRKNLIHVDQEAACPPAFPGRHIKTKFTTKRTGPEKADEKAPEIKEGVDEITLDEAWTGKAKNKADGLLQGGSGDPKAGTGLSSKNAQGWNRVNTKTETETKGLGSDRTSSKTVGRRTTDTTSTKTLGDVAPSLVGEAVNVGKSLAEVVKLFNAKPMIVTCEAQGCAGAHTRTLRVYPDDEVKVDLAKLPEIIATLEMFRNAFKFAEAVCSKLGFGGFIFKLLEPMSMELALAWQELEHDSANSGKLTKQRCNREWTLAVGGTLLAFKATFSVPLATLAGAAGAAKLASFIRDNFRVGADLIFRIILGLDVTFNFQYDRYEVMTLSGVSFKATVDIAAGISLNLASAGVTILIGATVSPTITFRKDEAKFVVMQLNEGSADIYFEASAWVKVWRWKPEISGKWTLVKYPYGKVEWGVGTALAGGTK